MALKMTKKNEDFSRQGHVFLRPDSSRDEVINAGEQALLCLYGADTDDNLDSLRYSRFCQKVSKGTSFLQPENLPPTSAAAVYHSSRVYYQVQDWRGQHELQAEDWGWKLKDGKLLPVTTHLPAAHESLLNIVRCNCKSNCSTLRCSCRKHGLECSPACGSCRGTSCFNSPEPDLAVDDSQESEDLQTELLHYELE